MLIFAFKFLIQSVVLSSISFFLILEFDNFSKNSDNKDLKNYVDERINMPKISYKDFLKQDFTNDEKRMANNGVFAAQTLNLNIDVTQSELDLCFEDKNEAKCEELIKNVLRNNAN